MTRGKMAQLMADVFENEINELRKAGQAEYAHNEENAFANFERAAEEIGISREKVLWVFAMKHKDGIASYLQGHKSQREDVRGRINDLIVYLFLLRGMIEENEDMEMADEQALYDQEGGPTYSPEMYDPDENLGRPRGKS